jgi:protein-tyrosine-phosphatase
MARECLEIAIRSRHSEVRPPMDDPLVLFLGRANAGRTLMAEALASRWAPGCRAASAGLDPSPVIDRGAALALRADLYPTTPRPRVLSDLLATLERKVDLVILLDPVDGDPAVPGNPPLVRWDVDDPRLHASGEKDRLRAWRGVLHDLEARIKRLVPRGSVDLDESLLRQRAQDLARNGRRAANESVTSRWSRRRRQLGAARTIDIGSTDGLGGTRARL